MRADRNHLHHSTTQPAGHIAVPLFGDLASPLTTQHNNITDHQRIHLSAEKAVERLLGPADDRLVLVKRSVEHHRHTGQLPEAFDQAIIARVGMAIDGLQTSGAIDMGDSWNLCALFFPNLEDLHHKGDGVVLFEPFTDSLVEHRRGKGTKRFPSFYLGVENGLHIRAPRITEDRAVAERARTP